MIIQSNEGVERLRNFLIGLQNDIYSGKQDYFIFKKDNGDYFFVTDACNQFNYVAIGTLTADGKGDGRGKLESISKKAAHYIDGVQYDPVERLCNMVKDMEFMGVVRDERVLIDSKSVTSYNRVRPTCEWAYALKKYQESVKNKEYRYRAHLKHKDGTVLAVSKMVKNVRQCVVDYLHKLPMLLSDKTYGDKQRTGRHSTLATLQKFARETFVARYRIPYEQVPADLKNAIQKTVEDAYYGMKEARQYE